MSLLIYWLGCGTVSILTIYYYYIKNPEMFYLLRLHYSDITATLFLLLVFIGGFMWIPTVVFIYMVIKLNKLYNKIRGKK